MNAVGSPVRGESSQKIGSYSNFISPRFAEGGTLKDMISSRTNSIEEKMGRMPQVIEDNFDSEVEFRRRIFYRTMIYPKRF